MGTTAQTRQGTTGLMLLLLLASSMMSTSVMAASTLVTTTTTTNVYDSYGNPTSITVSVTGDDGEGNPETYTTDTTNTYTNDTTNWFLGRLTRAEVTQTLPDTSSATRVSSFSYDATTGLLTQEVIEPDTAALTLTTDYVYDDFGKTKHPSRSVVAQALPR